MDREIAALGNGSNHGWFITKSGLTMVVVSRPGNELRRGGPDDGQHLSGRFAISSTEVPLELYKQFETHLQGGMLRDPSDKTPVTGLLALQMAAFCNWLSERDGIPATQFCYPPAEKMNVTNCRALPDALQKTGYRLPSVAEWELAAGCGSTASRFYGDDPKLLSHYGWEQINSGRLVHKVGELLPNPLGLFDTYGNAEEVCVSGFDSMALAAMPAYFGKGGSSLRRADAITTKAVRPVDYRQPDEFQGFRVVRSLNLDTK
jgi:formylglycine-generating enzyme required for sulfatase activity